MTLTVGERHKTIPVFFLLLFFLLNTYQFRSRRIANKPRDRKHVE